MQPEPVWTHVMDVIFAFHFNSLRRSISLQSHDFHSDGSRAHAPFMLMCLASISTRNLWWASSTDNNSPASHKQQELRAGMWASHCCVQRAWSTVCLLTAATSCNTGKLWNCTSSLGPDRKTERGLNNQHCLSPFKICWATGNQKVSKPSRISFFAA